MNTISNQNYTVCRALTWGYCSDHYRAICTSKGLSRRIFHFSIALIETFPILSQIISLFEMAIAHLIGITNQRKFSPPTIPISQLASPSDMHIELPKKGRDHLDENLLPLLQVINNQYRILPWPKEIQRITVFTEMKSGQGDLSASAKIINLMQRICPKLTFDWIVSNNRYNYDAKSFLSNYDSSKINIIKPGEKFPPRREGQKNFLIMGPVIPSKQDFSYFLPKDFIIDPVFAFIEIGHSLQHDYKRCLPCKWKAKIEKPGDVEYQKIYKIVFPWKYHFERKGLDPRGWFPMGIEPGMGVFIDPERRTADRSHDYYCFSYLLKLSDDNLCKQILQAMNVSNGKSKPNYEKYSFNFGYAHHLSSRRNFISCVAIQEKDKHVVIVLNQTGAFQSDLDELENSISKTDYIQFLKKNGYGKVIFKTQEGEKRILDEKSQSRHLTIIVRPSFSPDDVRRMQLASERLLATGDNSASESWAARCKLYLYENFFGISSFKGKFLKRQITLAKKFHPKLADLLDLFGNKKRGFFNEKDLKEIEKILLDPQLNQATLQFCDYIVEHYSLDEMFEAALKRMAWHACLPQLVRVEANAFDKEFRRNFIVFLKASSEKKSEECTLSIKATTILNLRKEIQEAVQRELIA